MLRDGWLRNSRWLDGRAATVCRRYSVILLYVPVITLNILDFILLHYDLQCVNSVHQIMHPCSDNAGNIMAADWSSSVFAPYHKNAITNHNPKPNRNANRRCESIHEVWCEKLNRGSPCVSRLACLLALPARARYQYLDLTRWTLCWLLTSLMLLIMLVVFFCFCSDILQPAFAWTYCVL